MNDAENIASLLDECSSTLEAITAGMMVVDLAMFTGVSTSRESAGYRLRQIRAAQKTADAIDDAFSSPMAAELILDERCRLAIARAIGAVAAAGFAVNQKTVNMRRPIRHALHESIGPDLIGRLKDVVNNAEPEYEDAS